MNPAAGRGAGLVDVLAWAGGGANQTAPEYMRAPITARLAIAAPGVKPSALWRPTNTSSTPRPSNTDDLRRLMSVMRVAPRILCENYRLGSRSVYYRPR